MRRFLSELWTFAREERVYWMVPLVGILLVITVVASATAGPLAPFVYAMF